VMAGTRLALRAPWRPATRRVRRARARTLPRHAPRSLAVLAVLTLALGGGWLWLRDSSLAAVRDVTITGLSGADSPAIRRALTGAATDMTTLHVRTERLRSAVAPYPIVKDVRVSGDFPHRLRIEVIEHRPVAAAVIDGRRVPVAADGTLLRDAPVTGRLPVVTVRASGDGRLARRRTDEAVRLVAAAPAALRSSLENVQAAPGGLSVQLRDGPTLRFGSSAQLSAKWASVVAVLADERAIGASYLDVRAPDRPVAGRFAPDAAPAGDPASEDAEPAAGSDAHGGIGEEGDGVNGDGEDTGAEGTAEPAGAGA